MGVDRRVFAVLLAGAGAVGRGRDSIVWYPRLMFSQPWDRLARDIGQIGFEKIGETVKVWPKYLAYSATADSAGNIAKRICYESLEHPGLPTIEPMVLQCRQSRPHPRKTNVSWSYHYQAGIVWLVVDDLNTSSGVTSSAIAKLREKGFTVSHVLAFKEGYEVNEKSLMTENKVKVVKLINARRIESMLERAGSLPVLY